MWSLSTWPLYKWLLLNSQFFLNWNNANPDKIAKPNHCGFRGSGSRFCHLHPSFDDNGYPPFKSTMYTKPKLVPPKYFYFLPTQAQKNHLLQLGTHGNPAKCDLQKIMGKRRFSNLTFENSLENKKCLIFQVII